MKKALITGITGQDGSYLAELLLKNNYNVFGLTRRTSSSNIQRIEHLLSDINLIYGDLGDSYSIKRAIKEIKPDEIYNLAAQSDVRLSFDMPEYTSDTTGTGTLRILEAIRETDRNIKFYQASSSELFGEVKEIPQRETTPFHPRSPYACAKAYSYYITQNYRESYDIFACNGILFNHESPRRGENFVTKKITKAVVNIKNGLQEELYLGNLDSKRDWGFAGDYVYAMWLMLQHSIPEDFVIATGKTHSVREFVEKAFSCVDINIEWHGEGVKEIGINKKTGKNIVKIDPKFFRPAEVGLLIGDYSKAREKLGWQPKVDFEELVKMMIDSEYGDK